MEFVLNVAFLPILDRRIVIDTVGKNLGVAGSSLTVGGGGVLFSWRGH